MGSAARCCWCACQDVGDAPFSGRPLTRRAARDFLSEHRFITGLRRQSASSCCGRSGRTCVPSIRTASRLCGLRPSALSSVGATCAVCTGTVKVCGENDGFDSIGSRPRTLRSEPRPLGSDPSTSHRFRRSSIPAEPTCLLSALHRACWDRVSGHEGSWAPPAWFPQIGNSCFA